MFLFERLFGMGTYMIILIFVCFLLEKTNISCKSILRFYLLCLCCMALFYKPYVTADLYRIFENMEYFSSMEFTLFWNNFVVQSSTPVAKLLFWCFGKTGINELLPAFSALFCYSLIFNIVRRTKQLYDISNQTVASVLFFIMTTSMYISVIGGIRMMIALSMLTYSYFRATVEKKIKIIDIVFFITSVFIHAMSFVVIGIIALTLILNSDKNVLRKIKYVFVIGLLGWFFAVRFSNTVSDLFEKILSYVFGDKYTDPWEYLMGVVIIIILLIVFFKMRRIQKSGECLEIHKFNAAAIYCVILAVAFCFEFTIFYRFGGHLAVMFSVPSMMVVLEKSKGQSSVYFKRTDLRTIMFLLSCIVAAISCTRGSLSSLKFFEL